jgi:dephospho-CoA kinase
MAAQASDLDRERQADIVIRNDGERAALEREADALAERLLTVAERRRA